MAQNPALALKLVPVGHLDDLVSHDGSLSAQDDPDTILLQVADLQTDYETLFGSLSEELGVTLATKEVQDNIDFIKNDEATGGFDLVQQPILNNPLGVEQVAFRAVNYDTTAPLPEGDRSFSVSGGLLMPVGVDKTQLKGVVVYFHGTTFSKSQVGSNFENPETQLCAQIFASQGYAVAIPDYIGQGRDWQTVHPYVLYPRASAQTAVDMLAAVEPILKTQYGLVDGDPALKLFSAGYSEGGAYSLWFNSYLSEDPARLDPSYRLVHSVGMEGAYSTSQVTYDYLFQSVSLQNGNPFGVQSLLLVNIVKPILSADAFLSYATYSMNSDFGKVFNQNFFAMQATPPVPQILCDVGGRQMTIAEAFAQPGTDISAQLVFSGLGKAGNGARYPGPLLLRSSTANGIEPLVSAAIFDPDMMADLQAVLQAADVDLSACDDGSVTIITLDADSVVVPRNFDHLLQRFPDKIRSAIQIDHTGLVTVSPFSYIFGWAYWQPIDHLQAPTFQFLYALNTFNEL